MKPIEDNILLHDFELSTGRRFHANRQLISIARGPGGWEVSHGYDGDVDCLPDQWVYEESDRWTPAERAELADYMIAQWQAFKDEMGR